MTKLWASKDGNVYVFAAKSDFTLISTNRVEPPLLATPTIAEGEIFLRSTTYLYGVTRQSEVTQ